MNYSHGKSRQKHQSPGARRRVRASVVAAGLSAVAAAITAVACSLVNIQHDECKGDAQCASLFGPGSTCVAGYCTATQRTGCEQTTDQGFTCFSCVPEGGLDFENACTKAECAPFDNQKRLTKLTEDGGLPALP